MTFIMLLLLVLVISATAPFLGHDSRGLSDDRPGDLPPADGPC